MNGVIWSILNRNINKYILSTHQQIVRLFCDRGSHEGGITCKTIIGTKTDFIVFLYKHCSVFSGKLTHVITKFILYSALFIRWDVRYNQGRRNRGGSRPRCPLPGGARGAKVSFQFKGLPWQNSELSEMLVEFFYEFASENARNAVIELQE